MRYDWSRLVDYRPRVQHLLVESAPVIGHNVLRMDILARLEGFDTASLLLITGSAGSGKSAVVRWLKQTAGDRVVSTRSVSLTHRLDPLGGDVERLVTRLRKPVGGAGDRAILVFDDVDHELLEQGIVRFVARAIADLDVGFIVLTMSTPMAPQAFPITPTQIDLEHRRAVETETRRLLSQFLEAAGAPSTALSPDLQLALHDLSEQTPDYGAVEFVIEMLTAKHLATQQQSRIDDLNDLLASQEVDRLRLPAIRGTQEHRLSFRRKDKTELLAELLRRYFTTPEDLANSALAVPGFDRAAFLSDALLSFRDAVLSLCLTSSPLDLVVHLLGPAQIRAEIDNLKLDPSHLLHGEAQAHLLIRGLGFTVISTPQGLRVFRRVVTGAAEVLADPEPRLDVVNSAAQQVVQNVEYALRDLVHFWAAFLFGSLNSALREYNRHHAPHQALRVAKLGTGDLVGILRFLNTAAEEEEAAFRLQTLQMERPISPKLLSICETYVSWRNKFEHPEGRYLTNSATDPAPAGIVRTCRELVDTALRLFEEAGRGSFPVVIKLSEIVFDEYSRRIFRAVDADDNELRFTLTDQALTDSLVVADHYYLLPRRRISINPHIVPRAGSRDPILFDQADAYDRSSRTQREQAERLFSQIDVGAGSSAIDVGCGTGRDALRLAQQFTYGRVHGIDISPDMVRLARARAEAHGLHNLTFEEVDLLDYQPDERVHLVFTSSTMHWFRAPEAAYHRLYSLLRPGGQLVAHQGGHDTYRGLHMTARAVVAQLGLAEYFEGWLYPLYYPTGPDLADLLRSVGFQDVVVESFSPPEPSPSLLEDFSQAGLLPFLRRLPEAHRDGFRREFLAEAHRNPPDLFTHRLYATARRR